MSEKFNPRVRRSYSIVAHDPDTVELRTGIWNTRSHILSDASGKGHLFNIVAGLDGTLSRKDLAKREGVPRADVEAVLDHLYSLGAIEERPGSALDEYLENVRTLGAASPSPVGQVLLLGDAVMTAELARHLDDVVAPEVVTPGGEDPLMRRLDEVGPAALNDGLAFAELAEEFAPWRNAFAVVISKTTDPLRTRAVNRLARELDITWLHATMDGPFLFVGPTMVPRRSACFECFETRVTMNLRQSASYLEYKAALAKGQVLAADPPVLSAMTAMLASHAALETINYLHTGTNFTIEKVLGIHLPTMEIAFSEVLPMPGCAACAPAPDRDPATLYFDPRAWIDE